MELDLELEDENSNNEIIIQPDPDFSNDESLLNSLKTTHKAPKGMYFDEDYFADLVINKYLPTIKRDENGKIISSDKVVEKEVLANMLLVVNAVINKYGIWRFGKIEVLRSEGLAECWRSLPTFDPSRKKKFFHFLSLVTKYHLINLTKKDKEMREAADIAIQPNLESNICVKNEFFFEDMECVLFDIIDEHFPEKEKHEKYIDLASILMEYVRENKMIIGKNDLFSTFREYGYKTSDYKKFIADIEPYKQQLYELAS
jgi:hypothetical protein